MALPPNKYDPPPEPSITGIANFKHHFTSVRNTIFKVTPIHPAFSTDGNMFQIQKIHKNR